MALDSDSWGKHLIDKNKFDSYLNLCTEAKSHLYLFSDGNLIGRYKTVDTINMDCLELDDNFLILMCENFLDSMCGRDYGNPSWIKLCLKLNLIKEKIEYYRK